MLSICALSADICITARVDEQRVLGHGVGDDRHVALQRADGDVADDGCTERRRQ